MSIKIRPSPTADTRTCDVTTVDKNTLLNSSRQHILDVGKALAFFGSKLTEAAAIHDYDKLSEIDWFLSDFKTKFKKTGWWDNHRKIHRHHLIQEDGVPIDVNLVDVLEFISDCVMAGMTRSGSVYELKLSSELLERAFQNTVKLLIQEIRVEVAYCPICSSYFTSQEFQYAPQGPNDSGNRYCPKCCSFGGIIYETELISLNTKEPSDEK